MFFTEPMIFRGFNVGKLQGKPNREAGRRQLWFRVLTQGTQLTIT